MNERSRRSCNSLVFPGTQGGPLMHVIAAKAVAFKEALQPEFKDLPAAGGRNARAMAGTFIARGYKIVSGGTDNHLMLVDLIGKPYHRQGRRCRAGRSAHHGQQERRAERSASPFVTSGLRIGTPAVTTRGYKEPEISGLRRLIARCIAPSASTTTPASSIRA
jgi:glycine hydroxymethyltransferase